MKIDGFDKVEFSTVWQSVAKNEKGDVVGIEFRLLVLPCEVPNLPPMLKGCAQNQLYFEFAQRIK